MGVAHSLHYLVPTGRRSCPWHYRISKGLDEEVVYHYSCTRVDIHSKGIVLLIEQFLGVEGVSTRLMNELVPLHIKGHFKIFHNFLQIFSKKSTVLCSFFKKSYSYGVVSEFSTDRHATTEIYPHRMLLSLN